MTEDEVCLGLSQAENILDEMLIFKLKIFKFETENWLPQVIFGKGILPPEEASGI